MHDAYESPRTLQMCSRIVVLSYRHLGATDPLSVEKVTHQSFCVQSGPRYTALELALDLSSFLATQVGTIDIYVGSASLCSASQISDPIIPQNLIGSSQRGALIWRLIV